MNRRQFVKIASGLSMGMVLPWKSRHTGFISGRDTGDMLKKEIPSSGEMIPAVGMGTYITFNVGGDTGLRDDRTEVLQHFFDRGGGMIDSSPMYGSSEEVIGYGLQRTDNQDNKFSATKIWTRRTGAGPSQIEDSLDLWGIDQIDLMQVHNLLNQENHLETIREYKEEGKIRYVGLTTSHGRRHSELEQIMENEPLDFVQLTYNVVDREPEERLLPLAREKGIAIIANRPFQRGDLFDKFAHHPLPDWVEEIDVENWAQFFLKFIISHPDITCAIPATSKVEHMQENMGSLYGRQPDDEQRSRMTDYIQTL